jgi:hypothetical protein
MAGGFAFRNGKLITAAAVGVMALSIAGVLRIEINDNPVRWFKENHRIRVADQVLNKHFAGTYDAFLVLEYEDVTLRANFRTSAGQLLDQAQAAGADVASLREQVEDSEMPLGQYFDSIISVTDDQLFETEQGQDPLEQLLLTAEQAQSTSKYFQSPAALRDITALQKALMDTGGVGKTNALPDVVKVHDGEASSYRIPATAAAVAQTLLQFQSSHRPQDLWHMVTPDFRSTAIWLQGDSSRGRTDSAAISVIASSTGSLAHGDARFPIDGHLAAIEKRGQQGHDQRHRRARCLSSGKSTG